MADENEQQQQPQMAMIKLDGSFGAGPRAHLTIMTKAKEGGGTTSEMFEIPYLLIDTKRVQYMCDMNFIEGYTIHKEPDARLAALRELGLG